MKIVINLFNMILPSVKRERKKTIKRQLTDAVADKEQQPKKRRKMSKDAEKQVSFQSGLMPCKTKM